MAKRLTEKGIEALTAQRRAYVTWDVTTGLGLKTTPRGKKVWLVQLKFPGRAVQSKRSLGYYPAIGLVAAREQAEKWYALVKGGVDPREEEAREQKTREADRQAEAIKQENTFGPFAEKYIGLRTNRRAKIDGQEIRLLLIPAWRDWPIHEIAPRDVRALVDKIKGRAPYQARAAWSHAVQIFKLAVHEQLIPVSPCASLDKKLLLKGVSFAARQRVLDGAELVAFWRATGRLSRTSTALYFPIGKFHRLLLLTGVRLSELGKAKWTEFHPELRRLMRDAKAKGQTVDWRSVPAEVKLWTVPRARFKSDAEHRVPLTDDALAILESLPRVGKSDLVFTLDGSRHLWIGQKYKRMLDAEMLRTLKAMARKRGDDPSTVNLGAWVNHDLRRTVRTNLSALDVADHVSEMVLGHGRRGLQRVYDQHKYEPQIRAALELWAARLRAIVRPACALPPLGTNVVALESQRVRR